MEEEKEIKIISPTVFSFMWFLQKKVKTLDSKEYTSEYALILKQ